MDAQAACVAASHAEAEAVLASASARRLQAEHLTAANKQAGRTQSGRALTFAAGRSEGRDVDPLSGLQHC